MDIAVRFDNTKRLGLCINCLSKGHRLTECPSTYRCKKCSRTHHSLLHRTENNNSIISSSQAATAVTCNNASVHTHMERHPHQQILLATASVLVRDNAGTYQIGRALLDSCSQLNFITDEFVQRLHLPKSNNTTTVASIGNSQTKMKYRCTTNIKSRITNYETPLSLCVTPHISYLPDSELDTSSWNIPLNIQLADEKFFKAHKIDLLIGTDVFFDVLSVGQIKLGVNLPKLQKTLLGWIATGKYDPTSHKTNIGSSYMVSIEERINTNLEKLWTIEEVSKECPKITPEQEVCEQFFQNTVYRESTGRIVVKLPFKDSVDTLGLSRNTAIQRFAAQERRFNCDHDLKTKYVTFMKEYEDCGHMTLVKNLAMINLTIIYPTTVFSRKTAHRQNFGWYLMRPVPRHHINQSMTS